MAKRCQDRGRDSLPGSTQGFGRRGRPGPQGGFRGHWCLRRRLFFRRPGSLVRWLGRCVSTLPRASAYRSQRPLSTNFRCSHGPTPPGSSLAVLAGTNSQSLGRPCRPNGYCVESTSTALRGQSISIPSSAFRLPLRPRPDRPERPASVKSSHVRTSVYADRGAAGPPSSTPHSPHAVDVYWVGPASRLQSSSRWHYTAPVRRSCLPTSQSSPSADADGDGSLAGVKQHVLGRAFSPRSFERLAS